jgi:tRNA A37 threonylcarbamoyladenosine dehydratase
MNKYMEHIELLQIQQKKLQACYKPSFYRIYKPEEQAEFNRLLLIPGISLIDYIFDQVKELIKYKTPGKKFTAHELEEAAAKHIEHTSLHEYGVWVYYPWSNRLVHILDEEEFIDIRTSRNQYKITREERDMLALKKIGVIGLSVGQSVAITLAMERICGELRLADFDILELTNLNRIRTGIHNLGLAKVYSVAREIAEIDPFIQVKCFPEGITEANMNDFFTAGGNLDLLVEESDGFDIKILSRYKARELKIPVIMEASDRCMVDVERFDLEPNRSILHGLVDHLDIATLKSLKTNEEKIPYMLDVLGIDTASVRLKASMLEIEQSINTWPQLASAVTMGGGITADVSRRMLLNQYTQSGRYHIDIEELIGDGKEKKITNHISNGKANADSLKLSLTKKEMQDIALHLNENVNGNYIELSEEEIRKLIHAAIKAPSGGNMQPWKWLYSKNSLFLFHDIDRSISLLDFDNLASYIGLGAATENLILKSHEMGLNPIISQFPFKKDLRVIAQVNFSREVNALVNLDSNNHLVSEIEHRLTNRTISKRQPIEKPKLIQLQEVASSIKGAKMTIIDTEDKLEQLSDIISKIERIRIMHERGHKDFVNEIRWNDDENYKKRDGVDINTVDLTAAEKAGFIVAKNWDVISYLKQWKKGNAFERLARKTVTSSSAICLITMPKYSPEDYFNGGRSVQRTWLAANKMNISFQPQSPATFLFARLVHGHGVELDLETQNELTLLRKKFISLMSIEDNIGEIFLFRLCISNDPKVKSLRKDLDSVFLYEN